MSLGARRGLDHVDLLVPLRPARAEANVAADQREQRVVLAHADVHAGVQRRTALTNDDAACADRLAAEDLDAEALRFGVAAVARAAACFLVCHRGFLSAPRVA